MRQAVEMKGDSPKTLTTSVFLLTLFSVIPTFALFFNFDDNEKPQINSGLFSFPFFLPILNPPGPVGAVCNRTEFGKKREKSHNLLKLNNRANKFDIYRFL